MKAYKVELLIIDFDGLGGKEITVSLRTNPIQMIVSLLR